MPRKRNPDDKVSRLIGAVGDTLKEKGYHGLGVNRVALRAGVSKPMVYKYFGSENGLLKAYIGRKDTWLAYFESLELPENPTTEELKNCFTRMLQDQFRFFHQDKEMQKLVIWQISEFNPLRRATCEAREREGVRLLAVVVEKVAKKTPFGHFDGYLIKTNTDSFIEWLWTTMGRGYFKAFYPTTTWPEIVTNWFNDQVDEQRKYTVAARLFYNVDKFRLSLKYLKKAAKHIGKDDKIAYSRSLINIGVMHYHLKEQEKVNDYYKAALNILQGSIYYYETASLLNNYALNLYKQDPANKERAMAYLEQALVLARGHDFNQSAVCEAGALCNLGLIHEYEDEDEQALDYYFKALAIDTDVKGDKLGEIELNRYIARIYKKKGNKKLSDQHFNRAHQLAEPFHKNVDINYDQTKR